MPYIAIHAYPKDVETQRKLAEKIQDLVVETTGCPPQAVTVSFEEYQPEDWKKAVVEPMIEAKPDKMLIVSGVKQY